MSPAALLTGEGAAYRALGAECYDLRRRDQAFPGGRPVIAHPAWQSRIGHPCRRAQRADLELALWALAQVRHWGGVLVQPAHSLLWGLAELPVPGERRDAHGGQTLPLWQSWFGHACPGPIWLYVVGYQHARWPEIPMAPELPPARPADEHLPPALAAWLVELVQRIDPAPADSTRRAPT